MFRWLGFATLVALAGCAKESADPNALLEQATELAAVGNRADAVTLLKQSVAIDPNRKASRLLLGRLHLAAGRGADAAKELERARRLGWEDNGLELARAYLLAREFDRSRRTLQRVPADARGDEFHFFSGEVNLGLGDRNRARAAFESAIEANPNHHNAQVRLALIARQDGDSERAFAMLESVVGQSSNNARAWFYKGDLELARGEYLPALTSFEQALAISPGHFGAALGAGGAELGLGRFTLARHRLEALLRRGPGNPRANYMAALAMLRDGDEIGARKALTVAISISGGIPAALLLMGGLEYGDGDPLLAQERFERFLGQRPNDLAARLLLAACLLELDAAGRALDVLGASAEDSVTGAALRGHALLQRGDHDGAVPIFESVARRLVDGAALNPPLQLASLGWDLRVPRIPDGFTSVQLREAIVRTDLVEIASVLAAADLSAARLLIEKLPARDPGRPLALYLAGRAAAEQQRVEEAEGLLRSALARAPAFRLAQNQLRALGAADASGLD